VALLLTHIQIYKKTKSPLVTKNLNGLKNKTTKAAKKMKESERRCMDDDISECGCKRLRAIEEEIKTDPRRFFRYVDLKKKRVDYQSVMNFEGQLGSGHKKFVICLLGL
jgi:hypothetical protein